MDSDYGLWNMMCERVVYIKYGQWRIQKIVLGGGEEVLWAMPQLGAGGRAPAEAGVLMHSV